MFGNTGSFPLSDGWIGRFIGRRHERDFFKARMSKSRSFEQHDFMRSVAADVTNTWTVASSSTASTWTALAEVGGWIRAQTGTSIATAGTQLYQPNKFWNGTKGAGFAALIRLSAVTEIRVEMGFADVLPAVHTNMVNSLASATFNSTVSAAVYVYDQVSGASTTTGLYMIGTSDTGSKVATTTNRFDSAATMFVALEINARAVELFLGDSSYPVATASTGFTAADGVLPFIAFKGSNTSGKNVDIDSIWTWTNGRN